jgi:excisionase family DNA binding protein
MSSEILSGNSFQPESVPAVLPQLQKLALSRSEAAFALSISLRTLDNLLALKEIPSRRIGTRVIITADAIRQFLRRDHPTRREEIN